MRFIDWIYAVAVMALPISYFVTLLWLMPQPERKAKPPREYQPGDVFDEIV